jgi:phosphotransferase system enzyme I (PtsP)
VHVGVMVEVPALLYQLDELLARVDFLSVGSNDLAQFMFAADRSNVNLVGRFDPISPPFLRALKFIVDKARAAEKPVTLCGELASQPIGALALVGIGFRSMSLSASSVGPVKAMLLDLDAKKVTAMMQPLLDGASLKGTVREKLEIFAAEEGLQL